MGLDKPVEVLQRADSVDGVVRLVSIAVIEAQGGYRGTRASSWSASGDPAVRGRFDLGRDGAVRASRGRGASGQSGLRAAGGCHGARYPSLGWGLGARAAPAQL